MVRWGGDRFIMIVDHRGGLSFIWRVSLSLINLVVVFMIITSSELILVSFALFSSSLLFIGEL